MSEIVKALIGAAALLPAGFAAFAGPWEEFERRCLVPMERHGPLVTSGLVKDGPLPEELQMLARDNEVWAAPDHGMFLIANPPDDCAVIGWGQQDGFDATGPAALQARQANGHYHGVEPDAHGQFTLVNQRGTEPPLVLHAAPSEGGKGPVYAVSVDYELRGE